MIYLLYKYTHITNIILNLYNLITAVKSIIFVFADSRIIEYLVFSLRYLLPSRELPVNVRS